MLVQNLAPGSTARLGLGYEELKARHPRLIVCDISGYGDSGPYRDRKAYDLLIQAEAGFLSVTGTQETPSKAGCSIADIAAGMYAYSSILAALLQRGRTGSGCRIDISMFDAMTEWMGFPLYYAFDGAEPPRRRGASHATIFPYGTFPVAGGGMVLFGIQNEREWKQFCSAVLEQPTLADDPRFASNAARVANRDALDAIIVSAFATLSSEEATRRLEGAGIANARVNDMHGVWNHPQLAARHRWTEIDSPAGPLPALLPPGFPGAFEPHMGAVPALGEHTDAILAELGLAATDIARLRTEGAI